jgi:hypothetical protein
MNIHAQIVDGVIEAQATGSVSTLDNLNHLIKNRSSQFGSNTDASFLGNMDSQQLLMILYCWVCDGYSGADLTREQVQLLQNPEKIIREKILKQKKGGLSNKLWRSAISASTREEEEILRALEPGDNLAALQAAFDPNEDE